MSSNLIQMIWDSFLETIIMVAISGGIGALAGIPLGILLFVTDRKSFLPMPGFNAVLGTVINALRSVPFIILLVAIIPFPTHRRLLDRHGRRHRSSDTLGGALHRPNRRDEPARSG